MNKTVRPLCVQCRSKPRAYAYRKGKKSKCELCGFKAQSTIQLDVLFVDGNLRNTNDKNLKTVCANCQRLSSVRRLGWRVGDLIADE